MSSARDSASRGPLARRPPAAGLSLVLLALLLIAALIIVLAHGRRRPLTWSPATPVVSLSSSRQLPVVLEDDELSLFSAPARRRVFFQTLRGLGVSIVRISSDWSVQAPAGDARRPPRHFDAADPNAYAAAKMAPLDGAVRAAAAAGLRVDLDAGFYAPLWATRSARVRDRNGANAYHRDVDARAFADYARMLATRYSGHFRPHGQSTPLPTVRLFEIWNEPNLPWDFAPQRVGGQPRSAALYRALVAAAEPAIHAVDPTATVLIGNTSSTGNGGGTAPLTFIEQLACVSRRLAPIDSGSCARFRMIAGDGWAQHPYSYDRPPWVASRAAATARIGDLARLQRLLDRLVALRRLAPADAHLWLTEEGYESNAQLPTISRWSEAEQAQFLAISEYEAWSDRQTVSFSQFLLRDTLVREALARRRARGPAAPLPAGTWTTGLERQDGTPKPALAMLRSPVVARPLAVDAGGCRAIEVWGRLQPDSRVPVAVRIEFAAASGAFQPVATLASGPDGVLDAVLRYRGPQPARVRLRFRRHGTTITSPAAVPRRLGSQPRPAGIPSRVACAPAAASAGVRRAGPAAGRRSPSSPGAGPRP